MQHSNWFPKERRRRTKRRRRTTTVATEGTPVHERCPSEKVLLPGIPDDITLNKIVPKLGSKSFPVLKEVSRGWCKAIETRQVYDARVRVHSTETLILFYYCNLLAWKKRGIALYSVKENSVHHLPPTLRFRTAIPINCQCVSLDGKIYVLGGSRTSFGKSNAEVYVLDMVEAITWKQCASMNERRESFACGVLDGKIYVFGGGTGEGPMGASEVYDPKENTWTLIMPIKSLIKSLAFACYAGVVGEEFVINQK